jgi:membrane protein DedA with SNARE-associated domain
MSVFSTFTHQLEAIAQTVPLPWFIFLGAFIEEVIAPIPSPFVMTLGGSIAASQSAPVQYLFVLAAIGAFGKTIGSWLIYLISDKAEDVIIEKFGRILGVSHKEVEGIGKLLNQGVRDDVVLFLLRAIPIMPTAPVSVVSGIVKLRMRTYLVSTFLGLLVRNMFYLYMGFSGVGALHAINADLDSWEKLGYVVLFGIFAALVVWFYLKRRSGKGQEMFDALHKRIAKKEKND